MKHRTDGYWLVVGALALACSVEEPSPPAAVPVPAASVAVRPDERGTPPANPIDAASEAKPGEAQPSPDPSEPSLADLLRLPNTDPSANARPLLDPESPLPGATPGKPSLLGVQVDSKSDPAAIHPAKTRTQTNAEITVDVTDSTRLRGGMRVQDHSDTEPASRVPTIGLEKRF